MGDLIFNGGQFFLIADGSNPDIVDKENLVYGVEISS
jgi:hypothetical protein